VSAIENTVSMTTRSAGLLRTTASLLVTIALAACDRPRPPDSASRTPPPTVSMSPAVGLLLFPPMTASKKRRWASFRNRMTW
jgi:hypothetical protein